MRHGHRIEIDSEAEVAYLHLSDNDVATTVEITPEVNVDLDEMDVAVGIEVLDLSQQIPVDQITKGCHIKTGDQEALKALAESIALARHRKLISAPQGRLTRLANDELSCA